MNILLKLRNPQILIALSLIVLLVSCTLQYSESVNQITDERIEPNVVNSNRGQGKEIIEKYVENHILFTKELGDLFLNESEVDIISLENYENLTNNKSITDNIDEIKSILTNANIVEVDKIISVLIKMEENNMIFKSSVFFYKYTFTTYLCIKF